MDTEETRWQLHCIDTARQIAEWRKLAVEKRQNLRRQYARLRMLGSMLADKGWVVWNGRGHYGAPFLSDRTHKERETIKALFRLQENIAQQAMLLLELDHACDCEEVKLGNKEGTNDDTDKTGRS